MQEDKAKEFVEMVVGEPQVLNVHVDVKEGGTVHMDGARDLWVRGNAYLIAYFGLVSKEEATEKIEKWKEESGTAESGMAGGFDAL